MEFEGIKVSKSYATEEVHFSGGVRGYLSNRGWALFPVSGDPDLDALVFDTPQAHFTFATKECGLSYIGTCVFYNNGENEPPMYVWESTNRDPITKLNVADTWGSIAHNAQLCGDNEYADCARYISVCLRLSGIRLKDISDKYHDQLKWAIAKKTKSGIWFANIALLNIYADFHSLASELCSARDHLAKIAAIHAKAPSYVDSLSKLEIWIKQKNHNVSSQPLINLLVSASGSKENPGWLRRLGAIRNEMIHRIPMAAKKDVSALILHEANTRYGVIQRIRLCEPFNLQSIDQASDPLIELSMLTNNLEQLCGSAKKDTKYSAKLPVITQADIVDSGGA